MKFEYQIAFRIISYIAFHSFMSTPAAGEIHIAEGKGNSHKILWTCQQTADSERLSILVKAAENTPGPTSSSLQLTISSPIENCGSVLSHDEDFNGDGQSDLSLGGISSAPTATRKIVLLNPQTLDLILAGSMPVSASRVEPGRYESRESAGGSIYTSSYFFNEFMAIKTMTRREARHGSFCTCETHLIEEGICTGNGQTKTASPDSPLCFDLDDGKSVPVLVDCPK